MTHMTRVCLVPVIAALGLSRCTGAGARTERSSVRGIGITAGRLGL